LPRKGQVSREFFVGDAAHGSTPRIDPKIEGGQKLLFEDVHGLYRSLAPQNPRESILSRHIVALNNASLDCYDKAGGSTDLATRELNLKFAMKGSAYLAQLFEALAKLRGEVEQGVSVKTVNVGPGGQAIVGNVEMGDHRHIEPDPISAHRTIDAEDDR
jgi:hypothetical protein